MNKTNPTQSNGYVAFLRGINVGGNKLIKMEELGKLFSNAGLHDVKTYIQSGNVLFSSSESNEKKLVQLIEKSLKQSLGYEVSILLRSFVQIEKMLRLEPFQQVKAKGKFNRYVTFLSEPPKLQLKLPVISPKKDYSILQSSNREIYSVSFPIQGGRFGSPLVFIEKEIGGLMTTRNWNTIEKIAAISKTISLENS